MTDITIPREALKAAMREYNRARDNDSENPLYNACLAMLKAWPGMMTVSEVFTAGGDFYRPHIILPLTENSNDKG